MLVLDSPIKSLDTPDSQILKEYLESLAKKGGSVIVMCRQLSDLQFLCNKINLASDKQYKRDCQGDGIKQIHRDLLMSNTK